MDKQFNNKIVSSGCNTLQKLASKRDAEDYSVKDDKIPCKTPVSTEFTVDVLSHGMVPRPVNGVSLINSAEYVGHRGSLLSLQPWIFRKASYLRDKEIKKVAEDCSKLSEREMDDLVNNLLRENTSRRVNLSHAHGRGPSCLRSQCSCRGTSKPLSSMEDYLLPQLYNENCESEEFLFSSIPSSTTSDIRPFVTDGSNIISTSCSGPVDNNFASELDNKTYVKSVSGVLPLPKLRTAKRNCRETPHEKLVHSNTIEPLKFGHHKDKVDALHIFSVGVSLGLLSTILSNRKEIDHLNTMLKSSENLVQDLQEELDALTVKELANEVQKPSGMVLNLEPVVMDDNDQIFLPMEESRSEIEAELEIELEKLEMGVNSSVFSAKMLVLDELDLELITDEIVGGELKTGRFFNDQSTNLSDCTSSTDRPFKANYSVSPRELSLRLHEVIQLRLQERIEELERELQQTQKQLQLVESDCLASQRGLSSSDVGSSSNMNSPIGTAGIISLAKPVCLNLNGESLEAYDEVYRDFSRVANMEENRPLTTNSKDHIEYYFHSSDANLIWEREGLRSFGEEPLWDQKLKDKGLLATHEVHALDEGDYVYDEEMRTLITRILEKTRQGSPIVQDVQRMLFALND
ncbi:uncharacterized protein LOC122000959 [Zingiber officinale]|uniref:Uncharacterized protein n=1 Tax=Zingiber officinale TaxID=94328 RepID=A0A8J5KTA2_ZINOF|nr:uncharacterized protein LOC122000959 [Zingiber officinale]KAG6491915.1 hypothetical protein ZIOFF_046856 [Zingiber officinale]